MHHTNVNGVLPRGHYRVIWRVKNRWIFLDLQFSIKHFLNDDDYLCTIQMSTVFYREGVICRVKNKIFFFGS
jgi:hypothetical protein